MYKKYVVFQCIAHRVSSIQCTYRKYAVLAVCWVSY